MRLAAAAAGVVLVVLVRKVTDAWWQAVAATTTAVLAFSVAFAGHAGTGRWPLVGLLLGVFHVGGRRRLVGWPGLPGLRRAAGAADSSGEGGRRRRGDH